MCPRNCISGPFAIFDARSHPFSCPNRQNGRTSGNFGKPRKFAFINVKFYDIKWSLNCILGPFAIFDASCTRSRVQIDKTALTAAPKGTLVYETLNSVIELRPRIWIWRPSKPFGYFEGTLACPNNWTANGLSFENFAMLTALGFVIWKILIMRVGSPLHLEFIWAIWLFQGDARVSKMMKNL